MIQGRFGVIQGTFGVIQIMMMIISPFGQLGLWAPSSGVQTYPVVSEGEQDHKGHSVSGTYTIRASQYAEKGPLTIVLRLRGMQVPRLHLERHVSAAHLESHHPALY